MRLVINRGQRGEMDLTDALKQVLRFTPASPRCAACGDRSVVIDLRMLAYPESAVERVTAACEACGLEIGLLGGPAPLRVITTPTN